jgi:NurA domain-containing protein
LGAGVTDRDSSFADLPDALVGELLSAADSLGARVAATFSEFAGQREELRRRARAEGLIRARADLDVVREPTVAAVDGSYQIHRLTSLDLCAAAAVGVEGTAREEHRRWEQPHHRMWLDVLPHSDDTTNALRGVMVGMELELAALAPHDVVLLDGAFAALVIYLNQSQGARPGAPLAIRTRLDAQWEQTSRTLIQTIGGDRVVAVPKYTSRNELAVRLGGDPTLTDAKTLATVILDPGEYTEPLPVYADEPKPYHVTGLSKGDAEELDARMRGVRVIFYRPFGWLAAMRLELPEGQARDLHRRAQVLEALARQLFTPAVFEPYPLFLSDRMVKSLGLGVSVVEQAISQRVVGDSDDAEQALMLLRQHRTEGGRGS